MAPTWLLLASKMPPRRRQDGLRRLQDGPRRFQEGPRRLQDASKTLRVVSKTLQRSIFAPSFLASKNLDLQPLKSLKNQWFFHKKKRFPSYFDIRWSWMPPRSLQDASKTTQGMPKSRPRAPKSRPRVPKRRPRAPKNRPRAVQERLRAFQECPRAIQVSREPHTKCHKI